jgi:hypothetical protein
VLNRFPEKPVLKNALVVGESDERNIRANRFPSVQRNPETTDDGPQLQETIQHKERCEKGIAGERVAHYAPLKK